MTVALATDSDSLAQAEPEAVAVTVWRVDNRHGF